MYTKSANTLTLGYNGEGRWCQLGVTRKESWMLEVCFFMAIFLLFQARSKEYSSVLPFLSNSA